MRRSTSWLVALVLLASSAPVLAQTPTQDAQAPASTPNVLVIIADDQAHSIFNRQLMPTVFSEIVDRGVNFDRAYVNTSQCCPSRAQIMTGLFGHHTGVDGNHVLLEHPTIAELMKDSGYRTILAGKYLNSWPCQPRDEWDRFVCIRGDGRHVSLKNPRVHIDGVSKEVPGYQTEYLAEAIARFVGESPEDPFFAVYSPTSPHMPANDDRYESLQVPSHRPPSFDRAFEPGTAPAYATREPLTTEDIAKLDKTYRKMARSTRALDDSIGNLLDSLGDEAEDTLIFYISDNGFLYGEHRLHKKVAPYEESVRVPFAIRFPALPGAARGATSQALVQNVDIAPTIADAIGREWGSDGESLLPLLVAPGSVVRDAALIENCRGENYPCSGAADKGSRRIPSFWGIVTDDYKYVEYVTGEREMFDLSSDPFEMVNLSGDPDHVVTQQTLAQRLRLLIAPPVAETTLVSGPRTIPASQPLRFRYFSQEKSTEYQCRLSMDGVVASWVTCGRFVEFIDPLAPGSYTFEVAARDSFNTLDPTPASRSFEVTSE